MLTCLVALLAFAATASAQDNNRQRPTKEDMAKMVQKRAESQAKELKLTDSQKEQFISLYVEYQTKEMELRQNGDEQDKKEKADKKKELTDAEADAQIEKMLNKEEQQLQLKKEYYKKMKDAGIPASKLVNVFGRQGGRGNFNRQNRNNNSNNGGPGFGGPGGGFGGPGGGFGGGF